MCKKICIKSLTCEFPNYLRHAPVSEGHLDGGRIMEL